MPDEKITQSAALPPPVVLYQIGIGHYFSRALYLAASLGIADLLRDAPRTHQELAQATETDPHSLRRVMRLLASVGVFEEQPDGKFELTPVGQHLRSDVPVSMRASVMLFTGPVVFEAWKELEYCVRTGEPAFRKNSPDVDDAPKRREVVRRGDCGRRYRRHRSHRRVESSGSLGVSCEGREGVEVG